MCLRSCCVLGKLLVFLTIIFIYIIGLLQSALPEFLQLNRYVIELYKREKAFESLLAYFQ